MFVCGPLPLSLSLRGGNDDDDDDDDACLSKTRWKRRMRRKGVRGEGGSGGQTGSMNRRKLAPPHKPIQRTACSGCRPSCHKSIL